MPWTYNGFSRFVARFSSRIYINASDKTQKGDLLQKQSYFMFSAIFSMFIFSAEVFTLSSTRSGLLKYFAGCLIANQMGVEVGFWHGIKNASKDIYLDSNIEKQQKLA